MSEYFCINFLKNCHSQFLWTQPTRPRLLYTSDIHVKCEQIILQWMKQGHLYPKISAKYILFKFSFIYAFHIFIWFFCLIHLFLNWCDRLHAEYYREQHTSLLVRRLFGYLIKCAAWLVLRMLYYIRQWTKSSSNVRVMMLMMIMTVTNVSHEGMYDFRGYLRVIRCRFFGVRSFSKKSRRENAKNRGLEGCYNMHTYR